MRDIIIETEAMTRFDSAVDAVVDADSPTDVALYAMQVAGLDIPAALCARIAERSEGDFRLVRNMMLLLEKAAKAAESFSVDTTMLETVLTARSWRRA